MLRLVVLVVTFFAVGLALSFVAYVSTSLRAHKDMGR